MSSTGGRNGHSKIYGFWRGDLGKCNSEYREIYFLYLRCGDLFNFNGIIQDICHRKVLFNKVFEQDNSHVRIAHLENEEKKTTKDAKCGALEKCYSNCWNTDKHFQWIKWYSTIKIPAILLAATVGGEKACCLYWSAKSSASLFTQFWYLSDLRKYSFIIRKEKYELSFNNYYTCAEP